MIHYVQAMPCYRTGGETMQARKKGTVHRPKAEKNDKYDISLITSKYEKEELSKWINLQAGNVIRQTALEVDCVHMMKSVWSTEAELDIGTFT